jgi:hypothetical protein
MIRWNASDVSDKCDEALAILAPALPIIEAAARKLEEVAKIDNLPQYIEHPASNAVASVRDCGRRARNDIDRIRGEIPPEELAKSRFKGKSTTLSLGEVKKIEKPREIHERRAYTGYVGEPPVQDGTRQTQLALR